MIALPVYQRLSEADPDQRRSKAGEADLRQTFGTSPLTSPPTNPLAGVSATAIALGTFHACAIVTGGRIKCWGYNAQGQLGNGTNAPVRSPLPLDVGVLSGVCTCACECTRCSGLSWEQVRSPDCHGADTSHKEQREEIDWTICMCRAERKRKRKKKTNRLCLIRQGGVGH